MSIKVIQEQHHVCEREGKPVLAKRGGYFLYQTHCKLGETSLPGSPHLTCLCNNVSGNNTIQQWCGYNLQWFYKPDPGPVYGFADPVPSPIDPHPALAYITDPPSGMLSCSSVTWIYANGCLHMLISHIYIKLNSLLHCFLTLCPHMINFPDFFQNRY